MKVVLLAAGYATRLYPLTRDCAKPLLDVGGRPLISRILEKILSLDDVSEVAVVSNARFADAFRSWLESTPPRQPQRQGVPVHILDDGSLDESDRLGAVGDLAFALRQHPPRDEAVLVAAGDALLEFDIAAVQAAFRANRAPQLTLRPVEHAGGPTRYNEVTLDPSADGGRGRVVRFREKPDDPATQWAAIALYFMPPEVASWVETYLAEGGNPDAPGHFIAWLVDQTPVFASPLVGEWFDIGTPETLAAARAHFTPERASL